MSGRGREGSGNDPGSNSNQGPRFCNGVLFCVLLDFPTGWNVDDISKLPDKDWGFSTCRGSDLVIVSYIQYVWHLVTAKVRPYLRLVGWSTKLMALACVSPLFYAGELKFTLNCVILSQSSTIIAVTFAHAAKSCSCTTKILTIWQTIQYYNSLNNHCCSYYTCEGISDVLHCILPVGLNMVVERVFQAMFLENEKQI